MRPVVFAPHATLDDVTRPLGIVLATASVALLIMPVFSTFGELLTSAAMAAGIDALLGQWVAPVGAQLVHGILAMFGYLTAPDGSVLSISDGTRGTSVYISWNCVGWQTLLFLGVSMLGGLQGEYTWRSKVETVVLGILGILALNVLRITVVALVAFHFGQLPAIVVHDYGSVVVTVAYLMAFWAVAYSMILERRDEVAA